ncbi:sulfatase-like hydrolase/transferase [Halopenitus sp. POP-27]|uniref:sulfatase-like hydrolase/transferase n=1 Tax=Halopenitus sp. POP-27 TaxID=2994425 RepID=UPI002469421F|nr:sulfatase-like hydrolase/transferase [Halopenitus sp. POP-27]
MDLKRKLIHTLPPWAKRALAVPYDMYQTTKADRQFARKSLPNTGPEPDAPDHIVCIVVDALRADHVDESTTPYLASLNGTDAITPGSWTFPAVSSVLSGQYPHEHGAMRRTDEIDDSEGLRLPPRMDDDLITITEALAGAGYDTYGGFGHDTPFVAISGRFQTHKLYHTVNSDADDVLSEYLQWVDGRDRTFAFLHLADPHIPVDPPDEFWEAYEVDRSIEELRNWRYQTEVDCDETCETYREHRRRLYRASVEYVDDAIARFGDRLQSKLSDPLLVVTSDHGEAHWEHVAFDVEHFDGTGCVDHGGAPYEEIARVPLLTNRDWSFDAPVSLVDLAPTFADAVGIDFEGTTGTSLREEEQPDRSLLVEGSLSGYEKKAVYDGEYKLIASRGHDFEKGFILPAEREVRVPDDRLTEMRDALPPWPEESTEETEVSGVVEDRLEQLGYT